MVTTKVLSISKNKVIFKKRRGNKQNSLFVSCIKSWLKWGSFRSVTSWWMRWGWSLAGSKERGTTCVLQLIGVYCNEDRNDVSAASWPVCGKSKHDSWPLLWPLAVAVVLQWPPGSHQAHASSLRPQPLPPQYQPARHWLLGPFHSLCLLLSGSLWLPLPQAFN